MSGHYTALKRKLDTFKDWLTARGAEVLAPTNEWEVLRFRTGTATSIIYRNKHDELTFVGEARDAHKAFFSGRPWRAVPATARRSRSSPTCLALRERDGDACFYCHLDVPVEEESVEHLGSLAQGFPDHIANMALAHRECNRMAGHRSIMEKIAMREENWRRLHTPGTLPNLALAEGEPALDDETQPPWET